MLTRLAGLALLASLVTATQSLASACNHEIDVAIKFRPGAVEWTHRGPGTHFVGYFATGQGIVVAGAGGVNHDTRGDLSWAASSGDPWQFFIEGPNGFTAVTPYDKLGVLQVDALPATGKYVISIGPCADWGEPGTLLIRTSDPRRTNK